MRPQPKQERIFDPALFKEYLRVKLISLLDSIAGRKLLMLEYAVRVPLNLVIERKALIEHEIPEDGGITAFEAIQISPNFDQIVIILSPTAENLKKLRDLIMMNVAKINRKFYPVFWPKRTMATKQFLESSNLMPYVEIKDFSFDLLPLDVDLYSLEMRNIRDLYIDDNHSQYSVIAQSIHRLQSVYGKVHNIFGKGKAAHSVYKILKLKEHEIKFDQDFGDIEHLIIFDRSSDFLTPLIKQITYEGLIDELYGINGGIVKVPPTVFDEQNKNPNKKFDTVLLNSERDYVFEEIRMLTLNGARLALKSRAKDFDAFTETARSLRDANEKAAAVKKIKIEQALLKRHLSLHAAISEEIKKIGFHKELNFHQTALQNEAKNIVKYYQSMIAFEEPLPKVLRSMCVQSIIEKGIDKKHYGRICDDIAMTYGQQHVVSLTNLARMGLFYEQGSRKELIYPFSDIRKELHLIKEGVINHETPTDPSFAYGGYCPVFTKLVENAIKNGWRSIMKALKVIPGETVIPENLRECRTHPRPAVVVYFVGGVTYSEVQTIRLLGKLLKKQMIVATTHMMNGNTMISDLLEQRLWE